MIVKFNKNQIEVLKRLLSDAEKCAEEYNSASAFRGYISSGINSIIEDRSAILPKADLFSLMEDSTYINGVDIESGKAVGGRK